MRGRNELYVLKTKILNCYFYCQSQMQNTNGVPEIEHKKTDPVL